MAEFLSMMEECGLAGFATTLVDHVSGQELGIPFESSSNIYSVTFLRRFRRFLEAISKGVGGEAVEASRRALLALRAGDDGITGWSA